MARPPTARPARRLTPLLLLAPAVLPFLPLLGAGFAGDDFGRIGRAALLLAAPDPASLGPLLMPGTAGSPSFLRPLYELSFVPELALFGPDPLAFHAGNLALHAAASLLAAALAAALFETRRAWLFALFFAAWHPLAVEPAGWIAARASLLCVTLGNGALLSVLAGRSPRRFVIGAALWLLALGAKESALGYAPVLLAAPFLTPRQPPRGRSGLCGALWRALPLAAVFGLYLSWRFAAFGGFGLRTYADRAPFDFASPRVWRDWLVSAGLLLAPLRADTFPRGAAWALGCLPGVLLAAWLPRGGSRRGAALGGLWLAGTLAVALPVPVDGDTLLGARNLYPAVAACAVLLGGAAAAGTRSARLAAAILAASFLGASAWNVRIRCAAAPVARALAREVRRLAVAARGAGALWSLEGYPFAWRGVPVGSALHGLLGPPWLAGAPPAGFVLASDRDHLPRLATHALELEGAAVRRWVWRSAELGFRPAPRRPARLALRLAAGRDAGAGLPAGLARAVDAERAVAGAVLELLCLAQPDGAWRVVGRRRVAPRLRAAGPARAGAPLRLEVRAPPGAQVAVLGPGLPCFHPVGPEGALLVRPARVAAIGFAGGDGRFEARVAVPAAARGALHFQAAAACPGGPLLLSARVRVPLAAR